MLNPNSKLHCNFCGTTFEYRDARQDEGGPLCCGRGRGEDIEEASSEDILQQQEKSNGD